MAVITVGYEDYLLPADAAMRVIAAMSHAVRVSVDFVDHRQVYTMGDPVDVAYRVVRPGQVCARPAPPPPAPIRGLLPEPEAPVIPIKGRR
jgi:hypothetical protein